MQRTVNPQVVGSSPTLPAIFLGFYEALWVNISFCSCNRDMLLASDADSTMVSTSSYITKLGFESPPHADFKKKRNDSCF